MVATRPPISSVSTDWHNNPAPNQSQVQWPRMSQFDIQKYTKVFVEVDAYRYGKITGEQATNLFLSWRLEMAVLKHVWYLSDQDNDGMLSLREFCIALYLMERFSEGRTLPAVLPSIILFDENLMPSAGQPWGPGPGLQQQQQQGMPGMRQMMPTAGSWSQQMQLPPTQPQTDRGLQHPNQQKSRVPVLEKHLVNQLSNEEQNSLNLKFEQATEADKKVTKLEKEILDSKEKIEFYHTKMQELVIYKSRCDNRLNEVIERALADKKEVEFLGKKYEEKYKQVGDKASRLTSEEAIFRDIQERKMELYNALVRIEQGDSTGGGILQVRADQIQSDLEELVKSLNDRCKKYGLCVKPTAVVELPFGWQPGIQEGAADWDEDWDNFEDEGFTFVKELTLDVQNVMVGTLLQNTRQRLFGRRKASAHEGLTAGSSSNADSKSEKPNNTREHFHDADSPFDARSEDGSARSSPGPESIVSWDKSFDEPTWDTFDNNDEVDSVWGTPSFNSGNSTSRCSEAGERQYDLFSIFDSFNDRASYSPGDRSQARFDSMRSNRDSDHSRGSLSFDDSDPFGSSGTLKTSFF
ncbi:hypothetical protein MKW92_041327 [Papaver armeniacum]|nr:hypothetical protein MKW92_041327 [Papaver armeniacum]